MMIFKKYSLFVILGAVFLLLPSQARALTSEWQAADYLQARLVSAQTALGAEGVVEAGLELRLADGWHSYWRMPGEGGLPPRLDWENSENVTSVELGWPVPTRFTDFGLYSFGYEGQVLFPLQVKAADRTHPVKLVLQADIMVCKDICVPQSVSLALDIPAGQAQPAPYSAVIANSRKNLPEQEDLPGLEVKTVITGPDAIVVRAFSQAGWEKADLFVETEKELYLSQPPVITPDKEDPRYATLLITKPETVEDLAADLMNSTIRLTLINSRMAIEKEVSL